MPRQFEYVGPPLTRERLGELLAAEGIRPTWFNLYGAHIFDGYLMDHRPEGWVIFYTERGADRQLEVHGTEAAACRRFFELLMNDGGIHPDRHRSAPKASE